jgi:diguanylate cyclase (GGDEF)-like protein
MNDIDHFKALNDTLGHQAGDECLKRLASVIGGKILRPGDVGARFGGEEFAVILPATPTGGAYMVAARMASAVERLALPQPSSPTGLVTLSIGIGTSSTSGTRDPASLIGAADSALYRAKREGRNRISMPQRTAAAA